MGFKTQYNDITLKDFCNLTFVYSGKEVILTDYYSSISKKEYLFNKIGATIDEIPEEFADYYVEGVVEHFYKDASGIGNFVYEIDIRKP